MDLIKIVERIVNGSKWLRDQAKQESQQHANIRRKLAHTNSALTTYLATLHSCPVLFRGGLRYPVTVFACAPDQQSHLDSILGNLDPTSIDSQNYVVHEQKFVETLRKAGKELYNDKTYVMKSVSLAGRIKIDCQMGCYYDALSTCDVLESELLDALGADQLQTSDFPRLGRSLPLRNQFLKKVGDPVLDGGGRSAALSISTLIVYKHEKSYRAFLRTRSSKTAAHGDLYHVVPSAMFQPQYSRLREEFSVRHNLYREYLEEVFNLEEVKVSRGQISHRSFYRHPELVHLEKLLKSGNAELFLTGYAMNLLNYRPEICSLLLIRDEKWAEREIRTSWEFVDECPFSIDVMGDDAEIAKLLNEIPATFVPPGAAAFWLGVDAFRKHIKRRSLAGTKGKHNKRA